MDEKTRQRAEYIMNLDAARDTFTSANGLVCDELTPEVARGHFVVTPQLCNPLGIAHGGVYYTLMDQLAGILVAVNGRVCVTLQSNINYLRSAKLGETVFCEVKPIHLGRSTGMVEGRCYDASGQTQASATYQFFLKGKMDDFAKENG